MCGAYDAREQRNTAPTQPCGLKKQWLLFSVVHSVQIPNLTSRSLTGIYPASDMSCRSRLATLNEKLTALERRIEYIEARVTKGETLT